MKEVINNRKIYIDDGIEIAKKIGKLYVTYRKKFIEQYHNKEKDIVTYRENKFPLKDSIILEHLRQQKTIGMNICGEYNNFIYVF